MHLGLALVEEQQVATHRFLGSVRVEVGVAFAFRLLFGDFLNFLLGVRVLANLLGALLLLRLLLDRGLGLLFIRGVDFFLLLLLFLLGLELGLPLSLFV